MADDVIDGDRTGGGMSDSQLATNIATADRSKPPQKSYDISAKDQQRMERAIRRAQFERQVARFNDWQPPDAATPSFMPGFAIGGGAPEDDVVNGDEQQNGQQDGENEELNGGAGGDQQGQEGGQGEGGKGDDEESGGPDNTHPYGEDESDKQQKNKNQPQKNEKKDNVVDGDKKGQQNPAQKKKDPWHPDVTTKIAKEKGMMPPIPLPIPCPECKKNSLFLDKWFANGTRLTIFIVWCIATKCVNIEDLTKMPHFLCLNKKCKHYYNKGWWYEFGPSKKLEARFNIFHIDGFGH